MRIALLLLLVACSKVEEPPASRGPKRELPLAEYKDTTILSMYEGSHLSWILRTKYLVKWPRTDLVKAKPVNLIVYDSLGKILVRVTSDSGAVDEAVSFLVASGHVHGHSEKGVDIQSDSLRWNKAINQISTEAKVRVVSEEGDVLTGKGFISDAKLDNWQILSDVKGVFQKVEERFQHADTAKPAPGPAPAAGPSGSPDSVGRAPAMVPGAPVPAPASPAVPGTTAPATPKPAAPATPSGSGSATPAVPSGNGAAAPPAPANATPAAPVPGAAK